MAFAGAKIIVRGVVQGVGFRYWCMREAKKLAVPGYAANLPDGSVEIEIEGDRGLVEEFIKAVKVGPTYSHVTDVDVDYYDKPRGYRDFNIKFKDW